MTTFRKAHTVNRPISDFGEHWEWSARSALTPIRLTRDREDFAQLFSESASSTGIRSMSGLVRDLGSRIRDGEPPSPLGEAFRRFAVLSMHGKLSKIITRGLSASLSLRLHTQIPQTGPGARRRSAYAGTRERDLSCEWDRNHQRACATRPRSSVFGRAAVPVPEPSNAGDQRQDLAPFAPRLSGTAEEILGSAPLGPRVLCRHERQRD